jgi:hypothetical protein
VGIIANYLYQYHKQITVALLVIAIITWSAVFVVFGIRLDALHAFETYCK